MAFGMLCLPYELLNNYKLKVNGILKELKEEYHGTGEHHKL